MGIHGQPREGGVTGRVLAWHPRSSGAAEGGARGHLLPSVTLLLLLPAGGHGAHRKAMGGAPDPPEVAQGRTPPSLPPPGAQTCAMLGRAPSVQTLWPGSRPHAPGPFICSVQKMHRHLRTKSSRCVLGTRGGSRGVWSLCSGQCQEVKEKRSRSGGGD